MKQSLGMPSRIPLLPGFLGLVTLIVACSRDNPSPTPTATQSATPVVTSSANAPPESHAEAEIKSGLYLGTTAKHACFLDPKGGLRCWGNNTHGELGGSASERPQLKPTLVRMLPDVAQAALGTSHTCALLRKDGTIRCWGSEEAIPGSKDAQGRITIKGLSKVTQLVAGNNYTCAVNEAHEVMCWGAFPGADQPTEQPKRVAGIEATRLAAASHSLCAVRTSGQVACWGDNPDSIIVPEGPTRIEQPTDIKELNPATDIATSDHGTCALETGGIVVCWGGNHFLNYRPSRVYDVKHATEIAGGGSGHFCARDNTEIHCFGERKTGVGGDVYGTSKSASRFVQVRAGYDFACGLLEKGVVQCWGSNDAGQLGQEFTDVIVQPIRLEDIEGVRTIATAGGATCAILSNDRVRCWGYEPAPNPWGEPPEMGPRDISAIVKADSLAMGGSSDRLIACAFTDGVPTCWGDNRASQIPTLNAEPIGSPSTLGSLKGPKAYSFGLEHACSLTEEGAVSCWGGLGKTRVLPTPVKELPAAATIALGADEGCALLKDSTIACWPLRDPLPNSNAPARFTPTKIAGITGATAIGHGKNHGCAVDVKGGVICWGRGNEGQLGRKVEGIGAAASVEGVQDVVEVALGDDFSCARHKNGTVSCWGKNDRGQLGDGTYDGRATAKPVLDLRDVMLLRAAASHVCVLTKKGEIFCWGDNRLRQLKKGPPLLSRVPLSVAGAGSAL